MNTLPALAAALERGKTTARDLVERALSAIADPAGEGSRTFLRVDAEPARAQADAIDGLRRAGRAPGPYAGIPLAVKDLFDIAGQPTPAGSKVLVDAPPAQTHAPTVARMLAAGFIPVGRTNMTEFAFSGLGLNPHWGTPASPWDRATRRIPGGSSSGTAVAVADGMAPIGLGTDTGGSCRVPAALCGVVGWKPTARRVPTEGVLPLSFSLDSIGPLANSVACCAIGDAILAGETPAVPHERPLRGMRLALPDRIVCDGLDAPTAAAFERSLARLRGEGAIIEVVRLPELDAVGPATARASLAACEAFAWHRDLLARAGDGYDQRVRARIEGGGTALAADYLDALAARRSAAAALDRATRDWAALIMPTVVTVPHPIAPLEADEAEYRRVNALMLRNTALANALDRCAISLPCHRPGEAPAGLMLVGPTLGDHALLQLAAGVEAALAG